MAQSVPKTSGMEDLVAHLRSAGVYGWEVRRVLETSDQLYLIFDQVESIRRVESEMFFVQLYLHLEKDGREWLGESGWIANPGDDFAADLAKALERAPLALNPVFHLPGPEQRYQHLNLVDPDQKEQPRQVLWHVRHDLNSAVTRLDSIQLASAEVYVNYREIEFLNHTGLGGSYGETELQTQFALLASVAGQEAESLGWRRAVFYRDLQISDMVQRYSRYALEKVWGGGGRFFTEICRSVTWCNATAATPWKTPEPNYPPVANTPSCSEKRPWIPYSIMCAARLAVRRPSRAGHVSKRENR
jgi:predicted Zn-dependent protease